MNKTIEDYKYLEDKLWHVAISEEDEHTASVIQDSDDVIVANAILDSDDEAALIEIKLPYHFVTTSVCVYHTGEVFCLVDWQGDYPKSMADIEEYDWDSVIGKRAIIYNGKPRTI